MNDAGVSVMTAGSAGGPPEETLAPGIKDFILGAYGVIFSTSAREAAEKMTRGTPEYREKTGRETVLRHRGANVMFGDPQEAYVVESNARMASSMASSSLSSLAVRLASRSFSCDRSPDSRSSSGWSAAASKPTLFTNTRDRC